jgi:hypothetical protein
MENELTCEEIKQIKTIKNQNIAVYCIIFSTFLSLQVNNGNIDLIINKENSKFTQKDLLNISKVSATIIWIVSIYFTIILYQNYEKEKTKNNSSFLAASFLALSASSTRLFTILNTKTDVEADEII